MQVLASVVIADLMAKADVTWEEEWAKIRQQMVEAGAGAAELARIDADKDILHASYEIGVAVGVNLGMDTARAMATPPSGPAWQGPI